MNQVLAGHGLFLSGWKEDDETGIAVARVQTMSTEIDHLMACGAEPGHQLFLQTKPTVIVAIPTRKDNPKRFLRSSSAGPPFPEPEQLRRPQAALSGAS